MSRARRLLLAVALFGAAGAWAAYWADLFFAARGRAEGAMERLQPLLAAGLSDPALAADVEAALAESHRALVYALAGPLALSLLVFAGLWILAKRAP
jgi:hypothetical protein